MDDGIKKARSYERTQLLTTRDNRKEKQIIPFVHTHNPRNQNLTPVVKQLNLILKEDENTNAIYRNVQFINSKRQAKNLKRILCTSSFKEKNCSVTKCNDPRCGTCDYILEGTSYDFRGRNFTVNADMSCETKNLIYVITCPGCNEFYIGETSTTLRARIRVHKQHINNPQYRQIKLSEHLDICGKRQFTVFPFYKMSGNQIQRREKEKHFITTLKPKLNSIV